MLTPLLPAVLLLLLLLLPAVVPLPSLPAGFACQQGVIPLAHKCNRAAVAAAAACVLQVPQPAVRRAAKPSSAAAGAVAQ